MEPWRRFSPAPAEKIRSSGPTGTTTSRVAVGTTTSRVEAGTTRSKAAAATTRSSLVKAKARWTLGRATTLSTRDTDGVDYIDCGAGFDRVETIHRDDKTLSNCERALAPRQGDT
jgi:hypothetical protein